ncbi:hypothetical protein [Burkholderia ambifaria]|uniref:hypothetical protein n=1 Tax=Burkholderia ambifaria TaxID=152480 RepID=UPI00158A4D11|nr:hypothetical protein [Burkholderia ambifaria]
MAESIRVFLRAKRRGGRRFAASAWVSVSANDRVDQKTAFVLPSHHIKCPRWYLARPFFGVTLKKELEAVVNAVMRKNPIIWGLLFTLTGWRQREVAGLAAITRETVNTAGKLPQICPVAARALRNHAQATTGV